MPQDAARYCVILFFYFFYTTKEKPDVNIFSTLKGSAARYCVTLLFIFYKNIVFPTEAEYCYFSVDFRQKNIFVNILRLHTRYDNSVFEGI